LKYEKLFSSSNWDFTISKDYPLNADNVHYRSRIKSLPISTVSKCQPLAYIPKWSTGWMEHFHVSFCEITCKLRWEGPGVFIRLFVNTFETDKRSLIECHGNCHWTSLINALRQTGEEAPQTGTEYRFAMQVIS